MNRVKPWGPPGHHCEWRRVAGLLFETLVQNGVGGQDFDKAVAEYKALVMLQPQTVKEAP